MDQIAAAYGFHPAGDLRESYEASVANSLRDQTGIRLDPGARSILGRVSGWAIEIALVEASIEAKLDNSATITRHHLETICPHLPWPLSEFLC
jgi:hypothetical protein